MRSELYALLKRCGTRSLQFVGECWGERLGYQYVCEYPRSGGTWLGQMLASYFELPFPQHNFLPRFGGCVVHNHWGYSPRLHRPFYLVRDGRDLATSMFYYARQGVLQGDATERRYFLRRFPAMTEIVANPQRGPELFPDFVESWFRHPYGVRLNWCAHVDQWAFDHPQVICLSYEELRSNCAAVLGRVIAERLGAKPDAERLRRAVERCSFEKVTGRQAGVEDVGAFARKGIVGDWQNHFCRAAGEVFEQYGGETLRRLGYETTADWWRQLPVAAALGEFPAPPSKSRPEASLAT